MLVGLHCDIKGGIAEGEVVGTMIDDDGRKTMLSRKASTYQRMGIEAGIHDDAPNIETVKVVEQLLLLVPRPRHREAAAHQGPIRQSHYFEPLADILAPWLVTEAVRDNGDAKTPMDQRSGQSIGEHLDAPNMR